jgi:hypothetical protein
MFDDPKPDLFEKFVKRGPEQRPQTESLQDKVIKAYVRMKEKAAKRNEKGSSGSKWRPQIGDLVLAKCQAVSDAVDGVLQRSLLDHMMGHGKSYE